METTQGRSQIAIQVSRAMSHLSKRKGKKMRADSVSDYMLHRATIYTTCPISGPLHLVGGNSLLAHHRWNHTYLLTSAQSEIDMDDSNTLYGEILLFTMIGGPGAQRFHTVQFSAATRANSKDTKPV